MSSLSVLAQNIELRKTALGITRNVDLSNKSGVSRAVLTNIKMNPNKSIMFLQGINLAEALECRPEWLATGEGSPNFDEYQNAVRVELGAPLISLNQLVNHSFDYILENLVNEFTARHPCPVGNSKSQFMIKVSEQIKNYPAGGYLYFDVDKTEVSGQLVIAKTGNDIEIMEYQTTQGRRFLKSLNEDLPKDLRMSEINDQEIIATFSAYTIF